MTVLDAPPMPDLDLDLLDLDLAGLDVPPLTPIQLPLKLDYATVKADLRQIAREMPDHVDRGASYYKESAPGSRHFYFDSAGAPSCLVGHLLARHGVTRQMVGEHNESGINSLTGWDILDVDQATEDLLIRAQDYNDTAMPWLTAVCAAVAEVEDTMPSCR